MSVIKRISISVLIGSVVALFCAIGGMDKWYAGYITGISVMLANWITNIEQEDEECDATKSN